MDIDSVQFATFDKRHDEIEARLTLEQVVHATEERMVAAKQDIFLQARVLDLLKVEEDVFSDGLDRVFFTRCVAAELREKDFAESAFTEESFFIEIF